MGHTLGQIAEHLRSQGLTARLDGRADLPIDGIASLADAGPGQLSHLSSHRYADQAAHSDAAALLLRDEDRDRFSGAAIVTDNPYLAYAHTSGLFVRRRHDRVGVAPSAEVSADAEVAADAWVGPGAVIGAGTRVERGARIHPNATIGEDCVVGADSRVMAGAVLYDDVRLGARCTIHSGAVLGADGFGYTPDARGRLIEIAQLGGVVLGDDVSVGSGTTIDRGALGDTQIGDGVKIDNQVQIGHNCRIGRHTLICGCVGIVGSTVIGDHCVFAGGSGVGGDGPVEICNGVVVSAMTHISQSVDTPGVYSGSVLATSNRQWKRNALRLLRLDELAKRLTALERRQS